MTNNTKLVTMAEQKYICFVCNCYLQKHKMNIACKNFSVERHFDYFLCTNCNIKFAIDSYKGGVWFTKNNANIFFYFNNTEKLYYKSEIINGDWNEIILKQYSILDIEKLYEKIIILRNFE